MGYGLVGRSITLAGATTKFRLLPNPDHLGTHVCNARGKRFDKPGSNK